MAMSSQHSGGEQQKQQQIPATGGLHILYHTPPPPQENKPEEKKQEDTRWFCKDCGVNFNSSESIQVHLKYHNRDMLMKTWAPSMSKLGETNNNNNTKGNGNNKREFISNIPVATGSDNSDSGPPHKSPEYNRTSPENAYTHPPTPQSYQSGSSPYQSSETVGFSPNFINYPVNSERNSPTSTSHYPTPGGYQNYSEQQNFFPSMDPNQAPVDSYNDSFPKHFKSRSSNSYRYAPYHLPNAILEVRPSQTPSNVSVYPQPQPTPSPSPKQCDKCGYVCETAHQLVEHINVVHPPTSIQNLPRYPNPPFMLRNDTVTSSQIEDEVQSEILDLDSHKVHQVYQEEERRPNGEFVENPQAIAAMLPTWSPRITQLEQQQAIQEMPQPAYHDTQFYFGAQTTTPQSLPPPDYLSNGVPAPTSQESSSNGFNPNAQPPQNYRPFEHLPSQTSNAPNNQVPNVPNNPTTAPATSSSKGPNWKSNEARRPKTYNCTACNKWFTSSGHLKRHYNTTLHKNAVKTSGLPDPAQTPISNHHHPAREAATSREDSSTSSPGEESRGEESNSLPSSRLGQIPSRVIQHSPNGPYDRQPAPNIHHTPPLHSPLAHNSLPLETSILSPSNLSNLTNGSPPNGEAGLSTNNIDSRGLLLNSHHSILTSTHPGYNMVPPPMMSMESNQFQMHPNESAPHVTQTMATNNINISGEYHQYLEANIEPEHQPLPSFAQIQTHRSGLANPFDNANVGGGVSVTTPIYTYYTQNYSHIPEMRTNDGEYRLTVLTAPDPNMQFVGDGLVGLTPSQRIININPDEMLCLSAESASSDSLSIELEPGRLSPEKAHTKRENNNNNNNMQDIKQEPEISSSMDSAKFQHKCIECDKYFNKACYLTQHNKTFHNGDKPFKCDRCGKRFSSDEAHRLHELKHAGEKPHKCEQCPKQFNHKTDLRRHMCLHTGQKPYTCNTCGKGFIRKDHMVKHVETHNKKKNNNAGTH